MQKTLFFGQCGSSYSRLGPSTLVRCGSRVTDRWCLLPSHVGRSPRPWLEW
ncbi:hypothetical protein CSUI_002030 [Cystoisospora suis]|uniref:Uncharacterized protein n=1 Tax=Cystoisospora suis TaxID=483139 RepID=A0A2C6L853_9APIC|nr:hypothetical protein CSUI_002030 [Cystoisospora suis]